MKSARPLVILAALICLSAPLHAGQTPTDSPQKLYLQAGKEERSGSLDVARRIYESIIDQYPESDFAVKANDRLLALQPAPPRKAEKAAEQPVIELLAPKPAKPLPAEPLLRQGVELARKKAQAETVIRHELERQREAYLVYEGHRVNRGILAEKEARWRVAAEQKVLAQFGMSLDEMGEKLRGLCKEAQVKGECNEEAFQLLSAAP